MKLLREVIGHNDIINLLRNTVDRRQAAHAYLFSGPAGVGKKTVAFAFTRALLCHQPHQGDACGHCRACRLIQKGNHPDVIPVEPAGSSIKIDQIREIQRKTSLTPFQGSRQVCIIDPSEKMTAEAANCFLKTLEEPPAGVTFILISLQPYALLPTITSRCQQVSFQFLSLSQVSQGLNQLTGLDQEKAKLLAILAGGSLGQALTLAADGLLGERRRRVTEMVTGLSQAIPGEACALAGKMEGKREEILAFLDTLLIWYRDLLVWQHSNREKLIFNLDNLPVLKKQVDYYNAFDIIDILYKIEQAKSRVLSNANIRLTLEILFMDLSRANAKK